jgi:7-keto-8-aminopelargonate synthetase-like enzyme
MSTKQREYESRVLKRLNDLKNKGLFRKRKTIESAQAARVILNGKPVLNFCSGEKLQVGGE